MTVRIAAAILPLLALAACGTGGSTANSGTPAAPVAAVSAPAGQQWSDVVADTGEGVRMGNPAAPIKLVEYGSRLCPTCGAFGREGMRPLIEKYVSSGKVSYEFREFLVHGAPDIPPALLGKCGGIQPFFPILEQMYINQAAILDKWQNMSPQLQASFATMTPTQLATTFAEQTGMIDFVKQRGIPEAQARACLGDTAKLEALAKASDAASASGKVTGTPTFIINDVRADAVSWGQLEPLLRARGA